jgi:hypothetical protein
MRPIVVRLFREVMYIGLGIIALGEVSAVMASDGTAPLLTVPAGKTPLHVSLAAPKEAGQAGIWDLVEEGAQGVWLPTQRVKAMAGDGAAAVEGWRLLATVPPRPGASGVRRFRLEPAAETTVPAGGGLSFTDLNDKSLELSDGGRPVWVYNHGVIIGEKVPLQDSRRSRACYIHPLWGLNGEVLTDDFPPDHYHHHGVFWAWPHVGIEDKEYTLWEYKGIAPKLVRWIDREGGPLAAVLAVENGWFVGDKKVMIERVWMRTFKASEGQRALDLDFTWIPTDKPITLRGAEGKSYGGLTVRFAVDKPQDSVITVPGGPAQDDLPETPLPWADLTAKLRGAAAPSGAAIFIAADHPDFPPTWLTRHYGALCVGWPGVTSKTFAPGQPIRLTYRIWIHKSTVDVEQLNQAYQAYVAGAKAAWQ